MTYSPYEDSRVEADFEARLLEAQLDSSHETNWMLWGDLIQTLMNKYNQHKARLVDLEKALQNIDVLLEKISR